MNKYTLHISGTHCASCKILIEDDLSELNFVKSSSVNLKDKTLKVEIASNELPEELVRIINNKIQSRGYTVSTEMTLEKNQGGDVIWKALPIGLGFLIMFFWLQKSGILNFGIGGQITPVTSFIIGLIASVSSCLALVGGLVLSLSAKMSQDNISDTKPFLLFHSGRLISFAILGGVLGLIGSAFNVSFTLTSILGIIASLVMLLLGLNLVGAMTKSKFTLPSGLFDFFRKIEHKSFTPLLLGFATFFLPCGFTQSMQISALSSGSFLSGFLLMFAFALGTLPMLLLLSFGSTSFARGKHALVFFKAAGIVVIGLGLFSLLAGLAGLGIIPPLFNI